jgi:hypothetical protein
MMPPIGGVRAGYISGQRDTIPDSELYYKINEGSGNTLFDAIADNNATSTGSLNWVQDSSVGHGYYVNLDGSNYIDNITTQFIGTGTDFSVGVEIYVDSTLSGGDVLYNWSGGGEAIGISSDGSNIGGAYYNGSSYASTPSHPEPSTPYNINLVLTYDSSAGSVELYLDESASTGSNLESLNAGGGHTLGADTAGGGGFGEGVARFAIWDKVVQPSEFTI